MVDKTGDLKKGTATAGVQRQRTGTAGRSEHAQRTGTAGRSEHAECAVCLVQRVAVTSTFTSRAEGRQR